jgi:DNA-binding NarL/FixJ family response regulator
MRPITVLLADDHDIVREGLCALLASEPNIEVIGEAVSGREAISLTQELSPDVVIMDLAMPRLNGVEATRQIVHSCPRAKIVVLSAYDTVEYVQPVLAAGASGYLRKDTVANELIEAVRQVHQGNTYFSRGVTWRAQLAGAMTLDGELPSKPRLSFREVEVLQLLAEGFTNKQVASELGLTVKTVESYRRSVMIKLRVTSVVGLVHYAVRAGVIEMYSAEHILN